MKSWRLTFVVALVMCSSCKPKMSSQEFNNYQDRYFAAYCTNDIRGAERALLDGLESISNYENNYTIEGTDFYAHRATYHERLFLIYQATHETNKMESELQLSLACVNQSRQSQHLPPLDMTAREFSEKLHNLDVGQNVQWETNKIQ